MGSFPESYNDPVSLPFNGFDNCEVRKGKGCYPDDLKILKCVNLIEITVNCLCFSDEPHWVEVLTEVLLSLLTRPTSLFRHVVDHVFTLLAPHLTLNALNMILEVSSFSVNTT